MNDDQLRALLRLKRYEQPPEGYYDRLLIQIRQNQRTELLRKSLWNIALDRFRTFFSSHNTPALRYAGATAGFALAGFLGLRMLPQDPPTATNPGGAEIAEAAPPAIAPSSPFPVPQAIQASMPVQSHAPLQMHAQGQLQTQPQHTLLGDPWPPLEHLETLRSMQRTQAIRTSTSPSQSLPQRPQIQRSTRYIIDARPVSYEPSFSF